MSRSMVSSPTLRLSRLTSSSRSASSSFGRARKAFSAPSRKRSRHSSTSATLRPCRRAASAAVVSPLSTLITRAARRFAVQRCTSSDCCSSAICHLARSFDLVLLVAQFPTGAGYKGGIALSTEVSAIKPLVEEKGALHNIGITELESQKRIIMNFLIALCNLSSEGWYEKSNAFLYGVGFTGAIQFFRYRLVTYCRQMRSFETKTFLGALAPLSKAPIFQTEVKGLGGKDAPKKIFDRLLDAFQPAISEVASIKI